ncbi:ABC transporter permease [Sphaerotilus mobilis]|uniref:NitT/TauT family transport system permease protein n=1 Tax=Sphaerotilus mobilis TaxID=47994 RepID=A0A4Q7LL68_9BURK|nr:ABC transporter permease [Sphaerotilus mobilis]RZS54913.1 NitT/TauT family transport system permease protein [Sphaerotilus mobilis]
MEPALTPPPDRHRPTRLWQVRQAIPPTAYWLLALLGLLLPLLGWIGLTLREGNDPVFLPGPWSVVQRALAWAVDGDLAGDVGISVYRVVTGWALSAVLALPLGLLIGSYRGVQALLEPLTDFIRYMPAVAFIPLVMLWFGIEESSKVAVIFIGTFFQMVLMVAEDVKRVPMSQVEAAQTMGATRRELLEQVILPSAKPALLDTLRITMGWAWTYLVVAELVAANSGLGYSILKAQRYLQTDQIFAGILLIGAIGLAMDQGMRWLHRKAFPWLVVRH